MTGARRIRGFSLLEMLVALAIVALLVAVLMPNTSLRHERTELQSSARAVGAALRMTRSRAIAASRETSLVVDVEKAVYRPAGAAAPVPLPKGVRVALFTAEDQELSQTVGAIRFYPDGSSSGGGVALLLSGLRYDVLVDWLTGGVSIHDMAAAKAG
jgi:general secretion pathway protein H